VESSGKKLGHLEHILERDIENQSLFFLCICFLAITRLPVSSATCSHYDVVPQRPKMNRQINNGLKPPEF
jgi:hypothetical protein